MTMRINLHEKKVKEAKDLFLPATLKDELGDFLPSLYSAYGLAIFKSGEEVDPEAAVAVEYLSLDVDRATTKGNYLMVAFRDNPGNEQVAKVMQDEYKKALLPAAPELVAYLDIAAIRDALGQIMADSNGKPWELGASLGDINDLSDVPGVVDALYTSYDCEVCLSASAFCFNVCDNLNYTESKETTSVEEAGRLVQEFYEKFGSANTDESKKSESKVSESGLPIGKRTDYFLFKFYGDEYEIAVRMEEYKSGGMALLAETSDGDDWADVSINLPGVPLKENEIFVDGDLDESLFDKIVSEGILKPTGETQQYNFGNYKKCSVDVSKFTKK